MKAIISSSNIILLLLCPHCRCNDGSQANYYHDPGQHQGRVVISLQGGGACDTVESCEHRCQVRV